jgi:hypothetical protein
MGRRCENNPRQMQRRRRAGAPVTRMTFRNKMSGYPAILGHVEVIHHFRSCNACQYLHLDDGPRLDPGAKRATTDSHTSSPNAMADMDGQRDPRSGFPPVCRTAKVVDGPVRRQHGMAKHNRGSTQKTGGLPDPGLAAGRHRHDVR